MVVSSRVSELCHSGLEEQGACMACWTVKQTLLLRPHSFKALCLHAKHRSYAHANARATDPGPQPKEESQAGAKHSTSHGE